ncbi:MAG TPA: Flp pilus assembly protein CpaB [Anaeromyxobacteraceae bacterium]|jgi:pilus assembly protein CpaB|nr:Flp pilus assembly protein CpaB [Anaeromyxobacteraceae bacterium]
MPNGVEQEHGRTGPERPASRSAVKAAVFIALALAAAGAGAVLLTRWVNFRTSAASLSTVKVVVAAVDLPLGTQLRADNLTAIDWPSAARPPSAVANPADLVGRVVSTHIYKSEPVLAEKLAGAQAGAGLAALVPGGKRAVSVRVDDVVGVAGFIHPGDSVDVIVTMSNVGPASVPVSKVILQNVKVLAVGKELDANDRKGDRVLAATVATLMVDSEEAERLALGASKGQLLLALRGSVDSELVETTGVAPPGLLGSAASWAAPAPAPAPNRSEPPPRRSRGERVRLAKKAAAPPPQEVQPPKPEHVVEILRGDLFERRDFDKGTKR